jgi:hypothetical protein
MLRWIARVWGVASFLLLLTFMAGGREAVRPTATEAVALLFFPVGVVVGFAIAWWRDGLGGLLTVGSLAAFHVYVFALCGRWQLGPYFLLFAAPGFLHLADAVWRKRLARREAIFVGPVPAGER